MRESRLFSWSLFFFVCIGFPHFSVAQDSFQGTETLDGEDLIEDEIILSSSEDPEEIDIEELERIIEDLKSKGIYNSSDERNGIHAPWYDSKFWFFILTMAIGISFLVVRTRSAKHAKKKWESGVFDGTQYFTQDSLLEAYVRLGGLMLRKDRDDLKGKMAYLHRYFNSHFAEANLDFMMVMRSSYQNPVELTVISRWLRTHLRSVSKRSQLIYFLAGLCAVDGTMNPKEKQFLKQISDLLDLPRKDFDSIMAMYSKYEDAYHDQFKQERRRSPSKSRSQYKREKAAEILGISLNASVDELKKAYRSLAKVHHPDRFATESKSQQLIAKERFVKIQLAYELLLEFKN